MGATQYTGGERCAVVSPLVRGSASFRCAGTQGLRPASRDLPLAICVSPASRAVRRRSVTRSVYRSRSPLSPTHFAGNVTHIAVAVDNG